ncbi:hypothetical protein LTR17_018344 [Elasticomyces elasticus]|nr:hypothetical protein LTR17_018344 [Elasticomyces elasticus]
MTLSKDIVDRAAGITLSKAKNPRFMPPTTTRRALQDITNEAPTTINRPLVTPAASTTLKRKSIRDDSGTVPRLASPDLDDDEDHQSVSSDELPPLKRYRTHLHPARSKDLTVRTQHIPQVRYDDQQSELDDEDEQSVTDSIKSTSSTMSIRERHKQKTPRQLYDASKGPVQMPEATHEAGDWSFLDDISEADYADRTKDDDDDEYDASVERDIEANEKDLPDDDPDLIEGEQLDLHEPEDAEELDSIR